MKLKRKSAAKATPLACILTAAVALSGCMSVAEPTLGLTASVPAIPADQSNTAENESGIPVPTLQAALPADGTEPAPAETGDGTTAVLAIAASNAPSDAAKAISQVDKTEVAATAPAVNAEDAPASDTELAASTEPLIEVEAKKSPLARLFSRSVSKPKKPVVTASVAPENSKQVSALRTTKSASAASSKPRLPGVRLSSLFQIRTGNKDIDDENVLLASAGGLARLNPSGLQTQTDKVEIACFRPELVRTLKLIERHYGRPVIVTSGYRSGAYNRRIGGARGSRHTTCEAADIQVKGVSKWALAKYARSMPNRGGVGTYCHTNSVHIDVGSERDWNWRCRRRK